MLLSPDRTGFPLIVIPEVELEVHLWPVSKIQIEQFVAESGRYNRAWYRTLLTLNERADPQSWADVERERLFISGILPQEALAFAEWLGEGFDLPTLEEWRAIYNLLRRQRLPDSQMFFDWAGEPVATIMRKLIEQYPGRFLLDLSLMRRGLVEWVRYEQQWLGLGAPRPTFYPNLWDPLKTPVRPLQAEQRLSYFGFRLVRRGQWDVANKPGGIYLF